MTRLLLVLAALLLAAPLHSQPVPEGDEIRVRAEKKAPWISGLYAGHDSTSLIMAEDGIERVYELMAVQRVEWMAPNNLGLGLLLGTAGGAVVGLSVEWYSLMVTPACFDINIFGPREPGDCNEDWAKAAAIGASVGAGVALIGHAIWPRKWKNVTKHYPPAGAER